MGTEIALFFSLTSFMASALLFLVQPMIGKMVLPVFGGTPAVWNTCLLFFQGTLLCGYMLAHRVLPSVRTGRTRVSAPFLIAFVSLLAAAYFTQPLLFERSRSQPFLLNHDPLLTLLTILCGSATLPLVMVSATAPLLQGWFSMLGHPRSDDPYFLYAASNLGSLAALVAYPVWVEPNLGLTEQNRLWRAGFLILAAMVMVCAAIARRARKMETVSNEPPVGPSRPAATSPTIARWGRWIILVFVPASWLLGVTAYLTTDLASVPLLWIIPLALYLITFILAFSSVAARLGRISIWTLPYLLLSLGLVMLAGFVHMAWIPLHLLTFFAGSLACHCALAATRPAPRDLSKFYITIALGGLLGGIWNAVIAPLIFDRIIEYPLALIVVFPVALRSTAGVVGRSWKNPLSDLLFAGVTFLLTLILATNQVGLADSFLGVVALILAAGLGALACVKAVQKPLRFALVLAGVMLVGGLAPGVSGRSLYIERDFFGVVRVTHDEAPNANRLFHGTTLHGEQSLEPALRNVPSTYFTRSGPIGDIFATIGLHQLAKGARVAIVGLGAGTLASYARPGQSWDFYEIDPVVIRVARDPRFFTYLRDCEADTLEIIRGDARQRLQGASSNGYQLIVLDAFSSDALPVHLLSREAIGLYRAKLAAGGVLVFNLSNRYFDLEPVIGRQAADAGLVCRLRYDIQVTEDEKRMGKQPSIWAVMAVNETDLGRLAENPRWCSPTLRRGSAVWTDDYSDLTAYLLFTRGRSGTRNDERATIQPQPARAE